MKAVIMCGGAGTRLRPLTENVPKPLIRLLGVSTLEHIIQKLIQSGFTDLYLSLGYKSQDIIDFCERKKFRADIRYRTESRPLGTAGGVKNCVGETNEPVIVLSGDNIFDFDLKKICENHDKRSADVTIVATERKDPREYGVILRNKQGLVTSFQEKPTWEKADSNLINTGIYILNGDILAKIPQNEPYDFSDQLFPALLKEGKKLVCFETEGFWGDIGEFDAYLEVTRHLLDAGADSGMLYSGTLYTQDHEDSAGNRFIAPCLIGPNGKFGKNNKIGPYTVTGSGLCLGNDCAIQKSILGDDVHIEDNCDITAAIMDDGTTVRSNCVMEPGTVTGFSVEIGKFSRVLGGIRIWPGRRIDPESLVTGDLFYDTPQNAQTDTLGTAGAVFSGFSLSDALRLCQAAASAKGMRRIGIGYDENEASKLYKSACACGIRACGVICYDFDSIYRAQVCFFSVYCNLDAFIYISQENGVLGLSFFGKNGGPLAAKTAREINNNYRFSVFRFTPPDTIPDRFNTKSLTVAYNAILRRLLPEKPYFGNIRIECENPRIRESLLRLLSAGKKRDKTEIQFLINRNGTDMYCLEGDRCYSSDRIKAVLCEIFFAHGKTVAVPEDAPECIAEKAKKYDCKVIYLTDNTDYSNVSDDIFLESLWNFDAVFLCAKLIGLLLETGIPMSELMSVQKEFAMRKKIIDLNCDPADVRALIEKTGAVRASDRSFFCLSTGKGRVRMRQIGNASKIKMLVDAANLETAKEVSGEISAMLIQRDY